MNRFVRLACLIAILTPVSGFSEGLRTNVVAVVSLSSEQNEGQAISLRYNEAVAILYPADATFIQGVEFELRIPKVFQGSESTISWSVYSRVAPAPSLDRFDYSAELVSTQALPARVSLNLILPIIDRHGIKSSPFASLIPMVAGVDRFPLMFKLSPIGKGFSPSMESAEFKLTVRPVLRDEGGIKVAVLYPEGADRVPASIYIDDKRTDSTDALILAKKGSHVLRVSAQGYREEVLTIAVAAGKVNIISVSMTPNAPLLIFQAPAGAYIAIDGQAVSHLELAGLTVEPGEHTLLLKIGDYSLTRKIMALRGKVYTVSLSVELDISTTP